MGSFDDYVNAAGGHTREADRGQVSVLYASGATATTRRRGGIVSRPRVDSGSVIVVGAKEAPSGENPLNRALSTAAQTSATLLSIILGYKTVTGN